jgi:hypothetical protein
MCRKTLRPNELVVSAAFLIVPDEAFSKPAAVAIPPEGYFELERGRYGPDYHGFSLSRQPGLTRS